MEIVNSIINIFKVFNMETIINILLAIACIGVFYLTSGCFSYLVLKMINIKQKDVKKIKSHPFFKPLKLFFILIGFYIATVILKVPDNFMIFINKTFRICCILLITSAFTNCVKVDSPFFKKLQGKFKLDKDKAILNFVSKILKAIIYCLAAVIIIKELGYDINGIIAGLGMAGLTVSLAGQDLAKNLFGGIVIMFDKPFVIGDWIQTKDYEGSVEDITFRSTRIRTTSDTVVTVPNSTITNEAITNWSRLNKRRIKINLLIDLNTSLAKLQEAETQIETMLLEDSEILDENIIVKFDNILDSGNNLLISCFTYATEYFENLKKKEDLNYKILKILEDLKVNLAYPTQTIYMKK